MSNLDSVRSERRQSGERNETPVLRRLGVFGTIALLILAMVTGLCELHLLPTFSADDFSSILFGAG